MLKILQERLQQYVNQELPDVQDGFRKGTGTRDQIASTCCPIKQGHSRTKHLLYWLHQSCVDHNKPWKILEEMGIADHLTCILKNLFSGQEATV